MESVTVNYLLAMEKSLRQRLTQLDALKEQATTRTFYLIGTDEAEKKVKEPTYDIRQVDKKITAINRALFEINHKIKESNAKTLVEVKANYDELVAGLE